MNLLGIRRYALPHGYRRMSFRHGRCLVLTRQSDRRTMLHSQNHFPVKECCRSLNNCYLHGFRQRYDRLAEQSCRYVDHPYLGVHRVDCCT